LPKTGIGGSRLRSRQLPVPQDIYLKKNVCAIVLLIEAELPDRLDRVLQVVYLVFNEGSSASSGTLLTCW
jgi:hypothetical protein